MLGNKYIIEDYVRWEMCMKLNIIEVKYNIINQLNHILYVKSISCSIPLQTRINV